MNDAHAVLATYERVADAFERARDKTLAERACLDRFVGSAEVRDLLDLGCGPGLPIARYLTDRGIDVTGVDGSARMVALFRKNVPEADAHVADMRTLDLGRPFDALLAFDSFFHLCPDDQRAMFAVFRAHVRPGGVLMTNTGPEEGEVWGLAADQPVYHASLSPTEYHRLFREHGFRVLEFRRDDETCGRSIWIAVREAGPPATG